MNLNLLMDLIWISHLESDDACIFCGGMIETGFAPFSDRRDWECADCGFSFSCSLTLFREVMN